MTMMKTTTMLMATGVAAVPSNWLLAPELPAVNNPILNLTASLAAAVAPPPRTQQQAPTQPVSEDELASSSHNFLGERQWTFRGRQQSARLFATQPTICDTVKQHAGFFQLGSQDKKYFFWMFESRSNPATDATIMWLTGGPGCSSQLALLVENGPCKVKAGGAQSATDTTLNPHSWNAQANLLYVDQPPGTGFSEGDFDHDEAGVAEDMYQFLQAFFAAYPQYNTRFFITGESYGGHYVPAVSNRVFEGNQREEGPTVIALEGLAVGNGLTDPEVQYAWYADMAFNSTMSNAPAVVSKLTYEAMKFATPACIAGIRKCNANSSTACAAAFTGCALALTAPVQKSGINLYDMRIPCKVPGLCYDFSAETAYLNLADVQSQLGVNKKWESCNMDVNQRFRNDFMHDFQNKIPEMLAGGVRVLIYAGDQDFICNWLGNKAWTLAMDWPSKASFNAASDQSWQVQGKEAGKIRSFNNFTFLQVYQGGHMVPMDQPENALAMINGFIDGSLA